MPAIPVLTPAQAASWDDRAQAAGVPLDLLMESAGRALAAVVADRLPAALARGVLVAIGRGNNGGDGWVLARALHRVGVPVWTVPVPGEPSPMAARAASRARADGVRELDPGGPWPTAGLVVDALLGTGATGAPRDEVAALLARIGELDLPWVAVDGPSGLDLGTGVAHGAHPARLTVTFGGLRRGHLLDREACGALVVVDIGLPPPDPAWPRLVTDADALTWLPELHARDHKGSRGRVVVIGGGAGMSGAPRLAARAALAAGAGLVHVVAPAESAMLIAASDPECLTTPAELEGPPPAAVLELVSVADAVVIGPGLGRRGATRAFVEGVLATARRAVVDADALVAFAGALPALGAAARGEVLLTPHPGEFRALAPEHAGQLEVDPWSAAEAAAAGLHGALLLKGVPTVVAAPNHATLAVAAGNPGLATGGSGDTLAGIAGAWLAVGLAPQHAGALASLALGRAAEIAARRVTARATRPTDVTAALPDVWRAWRATRDVPVPPRPPVLLELAAPALW